MLPTQFRTMFKHWFVVVFMLTLPVYKPMHRWRKLGEGNLRA